jgi:protein-tyrosine phosphatase
MIDLHCHVLPGLDEGPRDLDEAVAMVAALAADGIDTAVATPKLHERQFAGVSAELRGRAGELEELSGRRVAIVPGAEVTLPWLVEATQVEIRNASLGGRGEALLVEVPHGPLPLGFEDGVRELLATGYRVVLAHPEVSAGFQRAPRRLAGLVDDGALLQVTARALVRAGGATPSAALARDLVADGLCHVLATDAHSAGPWRAPDLRRGVLEAARLAGARAECMVTDAPRAILEGLPLPPAPRGPATRRGLSSLGA